MSNAINIDRQLMTIGNFPLDAKTSVGSGQSFETIDSLLAAYESNILSEGLLVNDANNSVTWQIYLDRSTWKARIYDGVFFVDVLCMDTTPGQVNGGTYFYGAMAEEDGYTCSTNDVALIVNCGTPHMNGPWVINTSGAWTRHPLFDADTDNIKNVIFVPKNGTVYSGSKWVFTTNGALNIENTMADFATGTWLDFEQLTPTKNYESQTLTSSDGINRFKRHTMVDATSGDIDVNIGVQILPNVEYLISKIDNTVNQVRIARTVGDVIAEWVLLEMGDWVRFIHYGDALSGTYQFTGNRINKTLTQATISATGKLSIDIPKGYRLYSITSTITDNSGDVTMDYGTASTLSDLDASVTLVADTPYTKVLNSNTIKEVWVTSADWLSGALDVTMLIVKEDENLSRLTTVNAATYNILPTDELLHVTYTSTGAVTNLQLMTNLLSINHVITVKDAGGNAATNNITITTESTEKIDGADTYVISANYGSVDIYTDHINFFTK